MIDKNRKESPTKSELEQLSIYEQLQALQKSSRSFIKNVKTIEGISGFIVLPILLGFFHPAVSVLLSMFFVYPVTYLAITRSAKALSVGFIVLASLAALTVMAIITKSSSLMLYGIFGIFLFSVLSRLNLSSFLGVFVRKKILLIGTMGSFVILTTISLFTKSSSLMLYGILGIIVFTLLSQMELDRDKIYPRRYRTSNHDSNKHKTQISLHFQSQIKLESALRCIDKPKLDALNKEWTDLLLKSGKDLALQDVEDDISFLYRQLGFPKPVILIADSYLVQKIMMNHVFHNFQQTRKIWNYIIHPNRYRACCLVKDQIQSQIREQVGDSPRAPLGIPVEIEMGSPSYQIEPSMESPQSIRRDALGNIDTITALKKITDKIRNNLDSQLRIDIDDQVRNHLENQLRILGEGLDLKFIRQHSNVFSFSDVLCFNDYLNQVGVATDDGFRKYIHLMKKGIYEIDFFENYVFISKLPRILHDDQNILHSVTQAAIQWHDGMELFRIHGVEFEKSLWELVVERKLNVKQILQIQNIEQRYIALQLYGSDKLLEELDARLINKSARGNELYDVYGFDSIHPIKLLRYSCPSTSHIYTSFVPDNIQTADQGMAWKFQLTEEQYAQLMVEA